LKGVKGDPASRLQPDGELTGVHRNVIDAAYEIIKAKGYTNWAIGLTVASIAECVLRNEHRVMPLSVPVKGKYGIEGDVYLSLPAVLGSDGVVSVLSMPLDSEEEEKLRGSATQIHKVQTGLNF
jgi:L-lactate dehydrogenase